VNALDIERGRSQAAPTSRELAKEFLNRAPNWSLTPWPTSRWTFPREAKDTRIPASLDPVVLFEIVPRAQ